MEYSTVVVPPGQQLRIDRHGLGILTDADTDTNASTHEEGVNR